MTESLRELLRHSIDYAGLFPPASLDLSASVRNYRNYREWPEQWMLARRTQLVSFGSCGFEEPREGLRSLGWL